MAVAQESGSLLGSSRCWAGAGMEPGPGAGGGRPLYHQGTGAAALAIQPPAVRLRARLRPDNQKNNPNREQRNRGPGKPRDFPRQGRSNQCVCKRLSIFITAMSTGLPELERVGATEAEALGSNPSSATSEPGGFRRVIEHPSNSVGLMQSGPGRKQMAPSC